MHTVESSYFAWVLLLCWVDIKLCCHLTAWVCTNSFQTTESRTYRCDRTTRVSYSRRGKVQWNESSLKHVRKLGYLYFYCSNLWGLAGMFTPIPHSLPVGEIKTGYFTCTLFGRAKLKHRKLFTNVIEKKQAWITLYL